MSESEQVVDITDKFQALTTEQRRLSVLSTSLTLMGLLALREQLGQICSAAAVETARPADGHAAKNIVVQFVAAHAGKLAASLTRTLDAMARHSPDDSDFVSRMLVAVFEVEWERQEHAEKEMQEGKEHAEDEGPVESATSLVGQSDGEATTADNG